MRVLGTGPLDSKICVLVDFPRVSAAAEGEVLFGFEKDFIYGKLLKAGIHPSTVRFESIVPFCPPNKTTRAINPMELDTYIRDTKQRLNDLSELCVIVPLGELCLGEICGKRGIDKWQLSLLDTLPSLTCRKAIPSYLPDRLFGEFHNQIFVELAFVKAKEEMRWKELIRTPKNFLINRTVDETVDFLERAKQADKLSIDIETSSGRINTFGVAISPDTAIAIGILPSRFGTATHHKIWSLIAELCQSDQPKILQNYMYETMYLSRYGIKLNNIHHDTMWAQKFLYPELKKGLDNVGRIYTKQPYWKEDNKNWNNIKDWDEHYLYNCKDTCYTYEGYINQRADLIDRNLSDLFYNFVMRFAPCISEMCSRGLGISNDQLHALQKDTNERIEQLTTELNLVTEPAVINPKSNKQLKDYFKSKNFMLYKKYDSKTKTYKESTNQTSLKKMRIKYKTCAEIPLLLDLSTLNKAKSSYLDIKYDTDNRMRFTLNGVGTETMRWSGHKDPWNKGINPQTVPGGYKGINVKKIFEAPEGKIFFNVDLKQAESRFVAYDSCDNNLIDMLEDDTKDIHSYVAAEIFNCTPEDIIRETKAGDKVKRSLGKKSGHGANYAMGVPTFIEQCIGDDIILTKKEAENVLESYHRLFPGIRRWHQRIRGEVRQTRKLHNPVGWERYFYGRLGDDLFREAYAFRPQSTIPYITNALMLYLWDQRETGRIEFNLLLQVHDSLLFEVEPKYVDQLGEICLNTNSWHPEVILPAGKLVIPTDCETGQYWGEMKPWG